MAFLFETLVPTIGFLMVLIIMLAYVGGKIFRIPSWEAYFNVELHNLVFAVLLLSVAFAAYEGMNSLAYDVVGASPVQASMSFLNRITNKGVLPMYKDLLGIEAGTAMSNSFYIRMGPGVWSYTNKIEPGADAILSMVRLMSMGLIVIYGSLSIQYIGLSLVDFGMPLSLSLGVLLFILPSTREAGAFLMCFALAFQIIFPSLYALNQVILDDMACARATAEGNACEPYDAYIPEIALFGVQARGVSFLSYLVPLASLANFELLIPFINAMAHLTLVSLFLPALVLTITIAFINALTKYILGRI